MLGLVLLVLFVHFGGSNVPKVLKDNKQMVYGVTIGLVLCSFFGVKVEGYLPSSPPPHASDASDAWKSDPGYQTRECKYESRYAVGGVRPRICDKPHVIRGTCNFPGKHYSGCCTGDDSYHNDPTFGPVCN